MSSDFCRHKTPFASACLMPPAAALSAFTLPLCCLSARGGKARDESTHLPVERLQRAPCNHDAIPPQLPLLALNPLQPAANKGVHYLHAHTACVVSTRGSDKGGLSLAPARTSPRHIKACILVPETHRDAGEFETGSRSRARTRWPAAAMRRASCANPAVASRMVRPFRFFPMALSRTSCC